ncbi:MAG TPA: hypothetical protein VFP20_07025 [Bacteroidales bacterium]|nr:hypothetical protein [Bacteroidales bacterium]
MKNLLLAFVVLFFATPIFAQEYVIKEQIPTFALGFQPQSFTYKAAEIDMDVRLSPRNWLTIAPRLQFGNPKFNSYFYDPTDAIDKGFGLGLTYRYFPLTSRTRKMNDGMGPFVSAAMDLLQTDYHYIGRKYLPYTDLYGIDGYTIDNDFEYKETVANLGISVNIGYSWRLFDIMYMETYLGVGVKMSDYVYNTERNFNLGKNYWDTGYSGYYVSSGFRIGVYLNRYKYEFK